MQVVVTTIGFKGISPDRIREWAWEGDPEVLNITPNEELFKSEKFAEARMDVIRDIVANKLLIDPSGNTLHSVTASTEYIKGIIYARGDSQFIKELYIHAARVKDPDVRLIQYTPASALDRKRALDKLLAEIRGCVQDKQIQIQLRAGEDYFVLWMKVALPHGRGWYQAFTIQDIDLTGSAPPLATKGLMNPTRCCNPYNSQHFECLF